MEGRRDYNYGGKKRKIGMRGEKRGREGEGKRE